MPRFQVRVSSDSAFALDARAGEQIMVDVGDGEVAPGKVVAVENADGGDLTLLTIEAPRATVAMIVGEDRVEVDWSD